MGYLPTVLSLTLPLSFRPSESTGTISTVVIYIHRYPVPVFIETGSEFRLEAEKKCRILHLKKKILFYQIVQKVFLLPPFGTGKTYFEHHISLVFYKEKSL